MEDHRGLKRMGREGMGVVGRRRGRRVRSVGVVDVVVATAAVAEVFRGRFVGEFGGGSQRIAGRLVGGGLEPRVVVGRGVRGPRGRVSMAAPREVEARRRVGGRGRGGAMRTTLGGVGGGLGEPEAVSGRTRG
jgi:hypothetical protein